MKTDNLVCVAIMVKNEEERICKTLSTVIDHIDYVVILDTGSDDNTMKVVREYCKEKNKPLKLEEEPFVDFSYNRNILLKHCYGLTEFILLLDANDEVRKPEIMVKFLRSVKNNKRDCVFKCRYEWEHDLVPNNNTTYYKIGLLRNNMPDIYYEFPIHEYITSSSPGKYVSNDTLMNTDFHVYQDRSKDKSSVPRILKDVDVLKNYMKVNGENSRAYRYLCQSLNVLKDFKDLVEVSGNMINYLEDLNKKDDKVKLYTKYNDDYYYGLMSYGIAKSEVGHDDFYLPLLKAYKYGLMVYDNAHPFYEIAKVYCVRGKLEEAYVYAKKCCDIKTPDKNIYITFVNYQIYDLHRWRLFYDIAVKRRNEKDVLLAIDKLKHIEVLPNPLKDLNNIDFESKKKLLVDILSKPHIEISDMTIVNSIDFSNTTSSQKEEINKIITEYNNKNNNKPKSHNELKKQTEGYKMYLLITYRDREDHLNKFIPHMTSYLSKLEIDYEIIVIEQADKDLFNKGLLYNIGSKFVENPEKSYICFHDVDIIPVKGTNYYKPDENKVVHLYGYTKVLGGIFSFNASEYIKINGFSNLFRGWGYEDTELLRRANLNKITLDHSYFFQRYDKTCFNELDHDVKAAPSKMGLPQTLHNKALYLSNVDYKDDGLSRLNNYEKYITVEDNILYKLVKVEAQKLYDDNNFINLEKKYMKKS